MIDLEEIIAYQGLLPLTFGMPRTQTRTLLQQYKLSSASFGHTKGRIKSTEIVDVYNDAGFRLTFDNNDALEFIELYSPNQAKLLDKRIVGADINELLPSLDLNEASLLVDEGSGAVVLKDHGAVLMYDFDGIIESVGLLANKSETAKYLALFDDSTDNGSPA